MRRLHSFPLGQYASQPVPWQSQLLKAAIPKANATLCKKLNLII
jgi:hypothetical protein